MTPSSLPLANKTFLIQFLTHINAQSAPVSLISIDPVELVARITDSFFFRYFHLTLSAPGINSWIIPLCWMAAEYTVVGKYFGVQCIRLLFYSRFFGFDFKLGFGMDLFAV